MKTYELSKEMVQRALVENETYNLAVAFANTTNGKMLKEIVTELFHQATVDNEDFDLTVEQFLYDNLDDSEYTKDIDAYSSEADAKKDGFYWDDILGKWLKRNFDF